MKQIIKAYLDDRATNDELFAVAYAKEKKSLDECIAYIFQEARNLGEAVCVPDETVFGWAVHYYDEDELVVNKKATHYARVQSSSNPELSDSEKAKILEEAKAEYKKAMVDKLIAEEKAKEQAKVKERKEKAKQIEESQMSIFDVI